MNTLCHKQLTFGSLFGKEIIADFKGGQITSDAGSLLLRDIDNQHGITSSLAAVLHDPRRPDRIRHDLDSMLKQRMFSIALGYEDTNDAALFAPRSGSQDCRRQAAGILSRSCFAADLMSSGKQMNWY